MRIKRPEFIWKIHNRLQNIRLAFIQNKYKRNSGRSAGWRVFWKDLKEMNELSRKHEKSEIKNK